MVAPGQPRPNRLGRVVFEEQAGVVPEHGIPQGGFDTHTLVVHPVKIRCSIERLFRT